MGTNSDKILLDGTGAGVVNKRFYGKALVTATTGIGTWETIGVQVDLTNGGSPQTITTGTGHSVDLRVEDAQLIANRSAGELNMTIAVEGLFW